MNGQKRILPIRTRLIVTFFSSLAILSFAILYDARDTYFFLLISTLLFELYAWMPYFSKILHNENVINKWLVVATSMIFLLALLSVNQLLFLLSLVIFIANYVSYYLPVRVKYNKLSVHFTNELKPINYCFKNNFFLYRFLLFFPVNLLLFYWLSFSK
ncbi:MAG TPA: hypothetical protein VE912_06675 [Bacteroidales bacterium]|nr:hypothetical protein [Bacteroidales bacterium]